MLAIAAFAGGPLVPRTYLPGYRGRMPRISDMLLDGVVFLFRTKADAEARERIGGTGFVVAKPVEGSKELIGRTLFIPYIVSNKHVVFEGGASVVSVNRRDGGKPDIIEYEPTDWVAHPSGDDVAIICAFGDLDSAMHKTSHIAEHQIVTPEGMKRWMVGVGDEVFMIGRFINLQGRNSNRAAARFGCISMMQERIFQHQRNFWQESFAVEMRSRTGFSGSPVAVYRTVATNLSDIPQNLSNFFGILGVNWGYILDEHGENTWLNGVVPGWKILDLLETPEMKRRHEEASAPVLLAAKGGAKLAIADLPDPPANDENPNHQEDFTRLLSAAARTREPKD